LNQEIFYQKEMFYLLKLLYGLFIFYKVLNISYQKNG